MKRSTFFLKTFPRPLRIPKGKYAAGWFQRRRLAVRRKRIFEAENLVGGRPVIIFSESALFFVSCWANTCFMQRSHSSMSRDDMILEALSTSII
jgi:hypothetical protein